MIGDLLKRGRLTLFVDGKIDLSFIKLIFVNMNDILEYPLWLYWDGISGEVPIDNDVNFIVYELTLMVEDVKLDYPLVLLLQ